MPSPDLLFFPKQKNEAEKKFSSALWFGECVQFPDIFR